MCYLYIISNFYPELKSFAYPQQAFPVIPLNPRERQVRQLNRKRNDRIPDEPCRPVGAQQTKNERERFGEQIKLKDEARKKILKLWQDSLEEKEIYPIENKYYAKKYFVYLQAQLLAQVIRGDIMDYPPYCWRL